MENQNKTCLYCGVLYPIDDFKYSHGRKPSHFCKNCREEVDYKLLQRTSSSLRYAKNREKILAYQKEYSKVNREVVLRKKREHNKLRWRSGAITPEIREKRRTQAKSWRIVNSFRVKSYNKKYKLENSELCIDISNRRRVKKLKARPKWVDESSIRDIYKRCRDLKRKEKISYSVDHIIPLQGVNVSGLDVPWNLQIITKSQNSSKSNKFDGTYDNESWRRDYVKN